MKTILSTILCLQGSALFVLGQNPGFSYQAVLRDAHGEVMPNANITLFVSLTDGPDGPVLYKENHALFTDELGILSTVIGTGTAESGEYASIVGVQDLNIKLEADVPGEADVVDIGNSSVNATPFALYGRDEDSDPDNEMQTLSLEGDSLKISGTPGVSLNGVNYWEKTDSSYILQFDDFARNESENFAVEVKNGSLTLHSPEGGSSSSTCTERTLSDGDPTGASIIEMVDRSTTDASEATTVSDVKAAAREVAEEIRIRQGTDPLQEFAIALTGIGRSGGVTEPLSFAELFALQNNPEQNEPTFGMSLQSINEDRQSVGLKLMTEEEYSVSTYDRVLSLRRNVGTLELKSNEGYAYSSGVVFEEKYFNETFGVGSVVGPMGSSWGGTSSTANATGLTTLSGAIPGADPSNGFNIVFNGQNFGVVSTINSEEAATTSTYGANGALNTTSGTFAGTPNDGVFMVFGADGNTPTAYMRNTASGSEVAANNITVLTSPPGRSNQTAVFSVPMGGEAAAYDRGTAQLIDGEATVTCSEHFQWVEDEASMTVTITPLSAESKGVAVIEKANGGFRVKELNGGRGNYAFDYLVMCKRKGQENFQVVREKPRLMSDDNKKILQHIPEGPLKSIRDLYK